MKTGKEAFVFTFKIKCKFSLRVMNESESDALVLMGFSMKTVKNNENYTCPNNVST